MLNMEAVEAAPSTVKTYTYKSGAIYEGSFDGALRNGRGHWKHPLGEIYEGEYKQNRQEGLGIYIFSKSGKSYLGNWSNGEMNGEGLYYFNREHTAYYFGKYSHDKKDGSGHYMYETGVMTTQEWDNGVLKTERETTPLEMVDVSVAIRALISSVRVVAPRELGEIPQPSEVRTFQFPSGATYTGQYNGTKKHGQGYWLHPEGDSYEGQFENNKHNGWGVYIIGRSGKKYVGLWQDGKMHGTGIYFFNPQETEYFVGSYRDDVKHGRGLYHFADSGSSKLQLWENGTLKQETDADDLLQNEYNGAIRRMVEIVSPYAPNYEPIAFSTK